MSKKTITQNNLPTFWNKVQAYINDRLPKGALASKDTAPIEMGGTNATNAKDARVNLGITYGTEVPTETPETGSGAIYFFEDEYTPISVSEGGTGASTPEGALENFGVADYIVEQGTSDIWHWEKWASGKAVCYGSKSLGTVSLTTSMTTGVYSNSAAANTTLSLPVNLFTKTITAVSDIQTNGYTLSQVCGLNNTSLNYRIWSSYSSTPTNVVISFNVAGTWK